MQREVSRECVAQLVATAALRVGVVVGDQREHVGSVAILRGLFRALDELAHLFVVARARSARYEHVAKMRSGRNFIGLPIAVANVSPYCSRALRGWEPVVTSRNGAPDPVGGGLPK